MSEIVAVTRPRRVGSRHGPSQESLRLEAEARRCLAPVADSYRLSIVPSSALAHWWILELVRSNDSSRYEVFMDGRVERQREVCRRLAAIVPEVCCDGEAPCRQAPARGPWIEVERSVPEHVRQPFLAGLRAALERRASTRVQVQPGRKDGEVVVFVHNLRRRAPLPLFFPDACQLDADDVFRIVSNVLEGMGPGFA